VQLSRSRSTVLRAVLLIVVAAAAVWAAGPPAAQAATNPTIVSLTFDDGDADQFAAAQTMKANNMRGTFYITTGWIGASDYLTRAQLSGLAADGHEIGGHTVTHADLTQVPSDEAQAQICNGRKVLQDWGFQPTDFAYPFSTANASVEKLAAGCGYTTSRGLGDVFSPRSCRGGCPYGESMPPADPQYLKAPDQVDSQWTLNQMKAEVTNAVSRTGRWVILTFHHVCSPIGAANCPADQSTTPEIFNQFVQWLNTYRNDAANNVRVQTVDETVRQYMGAGYPAYESATAVAPKPAAAVGANGLANASIDTNDPATGFPSCWMASGWGTNTPSWSSVSPGRTGTRAQRLNVTGYGSGDAKLLPTLDLHSCAPTVTPGRTYNLSAWYQSTAISQFALYYRDASGAWFYWTSSPWFAASATPTTWTQATFTTPAVPANATAMSFGLALIADGSLTTDDYSLVDPGGAGSPAATSALADPGTTAVAPAQPDRLSGPVDQAHARPYLPGGAAVKPHTQIAVPELRQDGIG
jgi:peptidoglycan/xylan/chitin deacetylase (PgdA/CDA1 family)